MHAPRLNARGEKPFAILVDGRTYIDREEAAPPFAAAVARSAAGYDTAGSTEAPASTPIARYRAFDVTVRPATCGTLRLGLRCPDRADALEQHRANARPGHAGGLRHGAVPAPGPRAAGALRQPRSSVRATGDRRWVPRPGSQNDRLAFCAWRSSRTRSRQATSSASSSAWVPSADRKLCVPAPIARQTSARQQLLLLASCGVAGVQAELLV